MTKKPTTTDDTIVAKVSLLPAQLALMTSRARECIISGGWGSGKTRAICYAAVQAALVPGNTVMICRATYTALRRSTLVTLIEGDGAEPVLPTGTYTYRPSAQRIDLHGGGTIYVAGLEDIVRIRSMTLGLIAVDEAVEISESIWRELMGRLRNPAATIRRIVGATNPASPSHWIYRRFIARNTQSREIIYARTLDNPHLPADYVEQLRQLEHDDPVSYRRYVLGEWVSSGNGVYDGVWTDEMIRDPDVIDNAPRRYIIGIDAGWTHPAAAVLVLVSGEKYYVIDEWQAARKTHSDIASIIWSAWSAALQSADYVVYYDPSAPALAAELSRIGWVRVQPAYHDVATGIDRIRVLMHERRLAISPKCTSLIHALREYTYDDNGRIRKIGDDLPDAMRYAIVSDIASAECHTPVVVSVGAPELSIYSRHDDDDDVGW